MRKFKIDESQELIQEEGEDSWILHINNVPHNSTPVELFKYYSLNEKNVDAIKNSYLYLNNPKDFNDPFDCSYNLIKLLPATSW